ncbi:MAG TPA: DUF6526 family protein [Longimicrobiales bacterium]|nr:DUF6526 family protein [Longimicrobiales bacterium]
MSSPKPQSFENHARIVPLYHGFATPIFAANVIWWVYRCLTAFSGDALMALLLGLAILTLHVYARVFALTVQDRVIRLEMKFRIQELLPPEVARRFDEFTVKQLVALRFAGDSELAALAAKVLSDRTDDPKAIKRMVKDWQADHLRA